MDTTTNSQGCFGNCISSRGDNLERLFPSAERQVGGLPFGCRREMVQGQKVTEWTGFINT